MVIILETGMKFHQIGGLVGCSSVFGCYKVQERVRAMSEIKHEDLREGDHVEKYDPFLGWVPGTMVVVSHHGDDLQFKADSGQYAPSPTWPDSRFRKLKERYLER